MDGEHAGGGESFQRTLAEKEGRKQLPSKNKQGPTDFVVFNGTDKDLSVLHQWLSRAVPQGNKENRFFPALSADCESAMYCTF